MSCQLLSAGGERCVVA
jgi:hypothetical protein